MADPAATLREAMALVAKHPGRYTGRHNFARIVVFLRGVDLAEDRHSRGLLNDFGAWLDTQSAPASPGFAWPDQVIRLAFPGDNVRPHTVQPAQQRHAVATLFELLDAYLADREGSEPASE